MDYDKFITRTIKATVKPQLDKKNTTLTNRLNPFPYVAEAKVM